MAIKYSNNARTTLAAAINSTVTTITVADASTFPTLAVGDEMYLTLAEPYGTATEIIKCTSVSGTTLTVVRGYEGTSALSWATDSKVQLRLTAGLLDKLLDAKIDDGQVLTDVPSGAVFTDTVYSHPGSHAISLVTGLQQALDDKSDDTHNHDTTYDPIGASVAMAIALGG
tara:strand:+ start:140 stop:652 length:513 start_codon:yes stop_codon:yes gene_type:complete